MRKRRPSTKRTKEEIAQSIVDEGKLDNCKSSYRKRYYQAFGQHWKLEYTICGNIVSIEQVDENYQKISL